MRRIVFQNESVDYKCAADLSESWDKIHPGEDTEYQIINSAVLGNSVGRKALDMDDGSSAWAAVHGRKYNNARIAIPFTRAFVAEHFSEVVQCAETISRKCTGQCAVLQRMMSNEQIQEGREIAMRTQAIRDAKEELQAGGSVVDDDLFREANRSVRGEVTSKVYFEHGAAVAARRLKDTEGLENKKQFKRKNVTVNSSPTTAYVVTMDEKGLKKIPIMNQEMRNKAEKMVLEFAKVVQEEISKIALEPSNDKCLNALKAIASKMPGDVNLTVNVPEYSEEELLQIAKWKDEVISNYRN